MEKQDIVDMLDELDMQLVRGKIDQSTYNDLKKKYQERLQGFGGSGGTNSLSLTSTPFPVANPPTPAPATVIEVLKCPKCGHAPELEELPQDLSQPIKCTLCDTVYTRRQSEDNAQKRKQEFEQWFGQKMSGMGIASTGTVDAGTRSFIFGKDLYPDLEKDVDRNLEDIENAPEAPMIPFLPLANFPKYQPHPLLLRVGQGDNQELMTLTTRLSAPQVQDFATMERDKQRIQMLQFRVATLMYYANVAVALKAAGVGGANGPIFPYQLVRQNVLTLQKDYRAYAGEVVNEAYRSYLLALDARLTAVLLLLDVLIPALEQGRSFPPDAALAQIERSLTQFTKAEQQANACAYDPLYKIPLQEGIQKDMMVARLFQTIVKCYNVVLSSRPAEFTTFFRDILMYTRALTNAQSPLQLLGLLQSIERMLAARAGIAPLPVLSDWSWLDAVIEGNRRKPTFGAAETVGNVVRHFHPYWVASLNYAEKKGVFFTSGTGREALILVDATSVNAPVLGTVLANDPLLPVVHGGLTTYNLLDKGLMALPALISRDMAEAAMKQYANQNAAQLGATVVKMIDLIYIPVAYVQYKGKNQQRDMLVGRLSFVNQNLTATLGQTHQFLMQYGV